VSATLIVKKGYPGMRAKTREIKSGGREKGSTPEVRKMERGVDITKLQCSPRRLAGAS
jgi:hypothetical protein